jgi:TetR/AcrR family transcriptional regulator, cholesterol catabolism regulator
MTDTVARQETGRGRLEQSQNARRARVLEAVLGLAREGGYDAVQLRPISDRTGVSTDTIYRYFGSRDQLISAAMREWMDREYLGPARTWLEGDTPAERILSFYRHVWEVWERNPAMLETFVRAALAEGKTEDGLAARSIDAMVPLTADALRDVDPDYRDDVLMIVEHVTHSAMTFVVRGHLPISEVYPQLERVVRRLAQHPAMAGSRPPSWEWQAPPE